jgi:hypothetical protein
MVQAGKLNSAREVYKIPQKKTPKKSLLKTSASKKNFTRRVTFDEYEYVTPARLKPEPKTRTPTPAKKKKGSRKKKA